MPPLVSPAGFSRTAVIANETSGLRLSPSLNHFIHAFYTAKTCTAVDVAL
jgi:hypothetical protein